MLKKHKTHQAVKGYKERRQKYTSIHYRKSKEIECLRSQINRAFYKRANTKSKEFKRRTNSYRERVNY